MPLWRSGTKSDRKRKGRMLNSHSGRINDVHFLRSSVEIKRGVKLRHLIRSLEKWETECFNILLLKHSVSQGR